MKQVRIALFTPFNPNTGGGAVIFRSLLASLTGVEVHWFYLANAAAGIPNSTRLGPTIMGGSPLADTINSARLFVLQSHPVIDQYASAIRQWSPDIVWVNAMNEGLLVGRRLSEMGVRLHVSVHDDPAGLANKSRRYRHLSFFMDNCNRKLLKMADTVDVVCESMQRYYKARIGVDSGVVYRYINDRQLQVSKTTEGSDVIVGHVGSAYSKPEVVAFLKSLRRIEETDGTRFKVETFGTSPAFSAAAAEVPGLVEGAGDVPERTAVERLQHCHFVYSMASFDRQHRIFRETSQPTKMSTYLMAAKPILAHCPEGSSMLNMMTKFRLGLCVTSMNTDQLISRIREMLKFRLEPTEFKSAIDFYCGRSNLEFLENCFDVIPRPVESLPQGAITRK